MVCSSRKRKFQDFKFTKRDVTVKKLNMQRSLDGEKV